MANLAHTPHDDLDHAVEIALAEADGDLLQAIRNLARRQHELEATLTRSVSAGYVRRQPAA